MLPLLAVMFTVLDLSIAIFVRNTVQFAVCQGVRYAVSSRTLPGVNSNIGGNMVVVSATGLSWAWTVPLFAQYDAARILRIFGGRHGGDTPCRRTRPVERSPAAAPP